MNARRPRGADHRVPLAGERDRTRPREAGTRVRDGLDREGQGLVRRRGLRVGVLQPQETRQRPADFRTRRADLRERAAVRLLAQEEVLQERDARRRRSRIYLGGRQQLLQLILRFCRPRARGLLQRGRGALQGRLVPALRGDADVLETRREILPAREQPLEDALGLRIVLGSALPLGLERERVRGLEIIGIQLEGPPPVTGRLGEVPAPALRQRLQPVDLRAVGRERRGPGQLLRALLQLLLAQQKESEVGPAGRLLRHERDHAIELLPRQHLLRRLHGGQAGVERRHRVAVRLRRRLRFPPRRARRARGRTDRDRQQRREQQESSGHGRSGGPRDQEAVTSV